jgi:DNA-binding NtrC family response regulator
MSTYVKTAPSKILIIGKQPEICDLVRLHIDELFTTDEVTDAWHLIDSVSPDVVLVDYTIPRHDVATFLETAINRATEIPVVIMGEDDELEVADYFKKKLGAREYLLGRAEYGQLGQVIEELTKSPARNTDNSSRDASLLQGCDPRIQIVGRSKAIHQALKMIHLVAKSTCNPVLIVGETGTGKELAARAIHILRHSSEAELVAVNCAALTANLLESELFGHVKGAFTGADREKTGLFELAGGGSVFLDEISEMPPELQAKLLRVLQEKTFRKVGGLKDIPCNATIIVSSNQNLFAEIENNRFRRDLYYRLAVCPVTLAPLRAPSRRDDIPVLAEHFLMTSNICPEKKGKITSLTSLTIETLMRHDWPGNVRELRNVIERAILLETTEKIGLSSLVINPDASIDQSPGLSAAGTRDFSLERAERELIARALQETDWQKTRAAALLGITRATLYAKVKQYNIQEPANKADPAGIARSPEPVLSM